MKMFTITESFIKGQKHVDVNRILTHRDFKFQITPYESTEARSIRVGINVEGILNIPILEEIKAAFPADECGLPFDRYHREKREAIATGILRRVASIEADFRGCRTDESRKVKLAKVLPEMRREANDKSWATRDEIVNEINAIIQGLADDLNRKYTDSAIQNMTAKWEGMYEEAGVEPKIKKIGELRAKIVELKEQVKKELNAWILADLEKTGWKVNGITLTPDVQAVLKEKYSKGEAFGDTNLHG